MRAQSSTTSDVDDIDLISIAGAVKKVLPKLAILAALVGAATAGVLMTMAPKYTAQAQVEVISTGIANPYDPKRDGAAQTDVAVRMDKEAVGTHVRGMLSTDIALRMDRDLGLARNPEFNSAMPGQDLFTTVLQTVGLGRPRASETDSDRMLAAYYKALRVFQNRDTRGITVEFTSSDPAFSAEAANKLADLYRESLAGRTIVETEDARAKIGPQIERLIREVGDADNEVTRFRGQANLFQGGTQATALKEQQLGELTGELTKAATARGEAEARSSAAREQLSRGTAEANPDVQKSALIPRLSEQRIRLERQVSELSATLLPAHPRMRQLNSDLAALQKQIKLEVQKVVDSLDRDAKIAAERDAATRRRIDEMKRSVVTSAPDDARLRHLENVAKSKRGELERLQRQYETAVSTVAAGAAPVEVKILQRAFPSNEKVWPKPGLIAPLAMLATLLFGLAWKVTAELITGARGGRQGSGLAPSVELSGAAVAAEPASAPPQVRLAVAAPIADKAAVTSAIPAKVATPASVAATLLTRADGQSGVRTLMTGQDARIDGGAEAVALARELAIAGKRVVLVEWSHESKGLAELVGGLAKPGMVQLLDGEHAFEDAIQKLGGTDVQFIPSGADGSPAAALFDPDRANLVLDALDEAYDYIVVYAPHGAARDLFAAIQGRFDVGVLVATGKSTEAPGSFLGFEVSDLDVLRIERTSTAPAPGRRSGSGRMGSPTEARA